MRLVPGNEVVQLYVSLHESGSFLKILPLRRVPDDLSPTAPRDLPRSQVHLVEHRPTLRLPVRGRPHKTLRIFYLQLNIISTLFSIVNNFII